MEPGHKRGDTQAGFYNLKEWLSGCGREGKDIPEAVGWGGVGNRGRDGKEKKIKSR